MLELNTFRLMMAIAAIIIVAFLITEVNIFNFIEGINKIISFKLQKY